MNQLATRPDYRFWILLAGALLATAGLAFEPAAQAQNPPPITVAAGGTADSNNRMIAVTGVDVTGQSVLYLVDTENMRLAVYQANGGAPGTQGVKFVGARNIALDLALDGFNDKTESEGKPLTYKDLEKEFRSSDLLQDDK